MSASSAPPPSIDALLAAHAAAIAALRAALNKDELPDHWDDIYLLRYCLSFAEPERAANVRKALAWRAAHAPLLAGAAAGAAPPHHDLIAPFQAADFHGATKHGDSLYVVRTGLSDIAGMLAAGVTMDMVVDYNMHYREVAFLAADRETRARRALVKSITLIDLRSEVYGFSPRFAKAIGDCSKLAEFLYPQLLKRTVLFTPPTVFNAVFAILKPMMSAKSLEKTTLCPGMQSRGRAAAACPFVSALFDADSLPSFLGGACRCAAKGGCVAGRPNEQLRPAPPGGPRGALVTVGARTAHDVFLGARGAGHVLTYSFEVASGGLEVGATLLPADGGAAEVLVPAAKHKAGGGAVTGAVAVPAPGTVALRFSNEHSLLTSKSVTVTARVEAAEAAAGGAGGEEEEEGGGKGAAATAEEEGPAEEGPAVAAL